MKKFIRVMAILLFTNIGITRDMVAFEPSPEQVQKGLAALALNLGIPIGVLIYRAKAYGGLDVVVIASRYELGRGQDMLLLKYAKNHDDAQLKESLLTLNASLLGKNWQQKRANLVKDFVAMNRLTFTMKHGARIREQILYLLNIYGAASSLYFKRFDPRTYLQPYLITTTSGKERGMYQLDRKLGID